MDDDFGFNTNPPFTKKIMEELVPLWFKMPQLDSYDGTSDPINHLENFKAIMLLHKVIDGILYWAFLSTLWDVARYRYSSLQAGSINCFEQLGRSFEAHFVTSQK